MWKCHKCGREFKKTNQDHYCGEKPANIDEYISAQPEDVQAVLAKIRETIHAVAPDAIEKISWSMPTFWQGENLIHFAAFKKHIGIYPGDLTHCPFNERLSSYKSTKGAIQFPYDKPIDYELIADIMRWRVGVEVSIISLNELPAREEEVTIKTDTVASLRLDAVLSSAFGMSRTKAAELIVAGRVSYNHQVCLRTDKEVSVDSLLSVRGLGRAKLLEIGGLSRKGRSFIKIGVYGR